MNAYLKIVLRDLGLILHVPGFMALVVVPLCFSWREEYAAVYFGITALFSLVSGQLLYHLLREAGETRLSHGMMTAALAWFIIPIIGAVPIWGAAESLSSLPVTPQTVREFQAPLNALFESFSGFTGTGLTMAVQPSRLPACIQWWRSFTEWVGGVGVIVLMLTIVRLNAGAFRLYYSEGREEKIAPTVTSTVRTIWWIYLLLTAASIYLLRALGMEWWPAVNYGMTAIATGGFGVTDGSFGDYGAGIKIAGMGIMFAGAISFAVHFQIIRKGRFSAFYNDAQHRLLIAFALVGALLAVLELRWFRGEWTFVDPAFQWISALTTAGLQSVDLNQWSRSGQLLLSLGMIVGGAAGSTVGGLKIVRIALLERGVAWRIQRVRKKPHQLTRYEFNGEVLSEEEALGRIEGAAILTILWIVLLWAAVVVLTHFVPEEYTLSEVILEVASAQGNVGLSTGITRPDLHWFAKITMILVMWMGRLEIAPALVLLVAPADYIRRRLEQRWRR
jgi:trk system potassium uptake protein TrkH